MIEYASVIFPEPTVAAINENMDPAIPPGRNTYHAF
jgi:hypothetical protein